MSPRTVTLPWPEGAPDPETVPGFRPGDAMTPRETPILMRGPQVVATLAGRKTVTRRTRGLDAVNAMPFIWEPPTPMPDGLWVFAPRRDAIAVRCPYGGPGDRLWVRETWQAVHVETPDINGEYDVYAAPNIPKDNRHGWWSVLYAATDPDGDAHRDDREAWRPSIYMPKWAARLWLEITDVRPERLHEITPADARREGHPVEPWRSDDREVHDDAAMDWFRDTWEDIHGPGSWEGNPWVWRIEYRRMEGP